MASCLLCLEINKDRLDCIMVNSTRWQELDIAKKIEKHFWSLSTFQTGSWICLSCWREVDGFHKFFLHIEEAHVNFGKIKVEDCEVSTEGIVELTIQKSNIKKYEGGESDDDNVALILEPEILIDQTQRRNLTEPEIFIDNPETHQFEAGNETALTALDEIDLDYIPIEDECKPLRLASKDPLQKSKKSKKQTSKRKGAADLKTKDTKLNDSEVKEEPVDINDKDSDSMSDNHNNINFQPVKDCSQTAKCSKANKARKENDQFLVEHFKQMACDLCQVPFEDFPAMKKHFNRIHKQRGYVVCCNRKFFDRTRLVDHLHCHLNPDHFKCKECGKTMSERVSYANHMLRVHRANEVVKQHSCEVCGKSFTKAYVLRSHKLTHLPEEEKKFPCSDCGKNYGSSYVLKLHKEAVHLKRFAKICYICGKAINSSAEFKVHMNKHEGIRLPISCDVCGLRLTSERGLKLHKESQHPVGGKKDHQCSVCYKKSPTRKALLKHINTMHKKGYTHTCSICEKAFKRPETLREHMATHTGTALYNCPWCPKTFNSNGNLHAHRKKMHPKEWEESKLQKYSRIVLPEV